MFEERKSVAFEEMKALRSKNSQINLLVSEIERKIDALIEIRNSTRSYNPKGSINQKVSIKVNAVKITLEEKNIIRSYLYYKYVQKVKGDAFNIRKCLFTNKYRVSTYDVDWD